MNARLCLIEDDPTISELVSEKLSRDGYDVSTYDDIDPFIENSTAPTWDLYILDILLRGRKNGFDLCKHIRNYSSTVPILILSALSEPTDRIEGLKLGADDYLTKPFEMEELLLRVQGMIRRQAWYRKLPQDRSVFCWDDFEVDFVKFEGKKGNQLFSLSQKEAMLMKLFIEKMGEVVTRDEILDRVWGYHVFPSARTVDNVVMRLRKFFEEDAKNPKHLHSIRGLGYKFTT